MQAIKPFFRTSPRSSSPAPALAPPLPAPVRQDSATDADAPMMHTMTRTSSRGALNKLSLNSFRSRTPTGPSNGTNGPALVQDGSYLEALNLKISEAIAKALAPPNCPVPGAATDDTFNSKRAIPVGRGTALGEVFAVELNAAKENPQLYRAIVRSLQRPLSVLLTNLSSQLLPVVSSPMFQACDLTTGPNCAQLHALAIAGFAAEVVKTFDQLGLGFGGLTDTRGDGLQGIRDGLEGIIGRVLTPLFALIKQDLGPVLAELEKPVNETWLPSIKNPPIKSNLPIQAYHPAVGTLSVHIAAHVKSITRYSSVIGRHCDSHVVSLTIGMIWKALLALSNRPPREAPSPPVVPVPSSKKKFTPPPTPRMMGLKGTLGGSRPPSPPLPLPSSRTADTKAVAELLHQLPRPLSVNKDACEAVDEAFDDFRALSLLFETLDTFSGKLELRDLSILTDDLPTLIALPVLLNSSNVQCGGIGNHVPALLGMDVAEYRQACLASFGREEECCEAVGKKLLEVMASKNADNCVLFDWLKREIQ